MMTLLRGKCLWKNEELLSIRTSALPHRRHALVEVGDLGKLPFKREHH